MHRSKILDLLNMMHNFEAHIKIKKMYINVKYQHIDNITFFGIKTIPSARIENSKLKTRCNIR